MVGDDDARAEDDALRADANPTVALHVDQRLDMRDHRPTMHVAPGPRSCAALALAWCLLGCACGIEPNYTDPDGPRYAGDHAAAQPPAGGPLLVVSYNLAFGREVATAIDVLGQAPLVGADLVLMQEMEACGVDRIAREVGLNYVYYPASRKKGQDWGNAVLSRWPIVEDRKLLLPYADPFSNSRRIAVATRIDVGGEEILVYSTHIATPSLGLGARLDQIETILDDADQTDPELPALIGGDLNTADPGSGGQVRELFSDHDFTWASDDATDTGTAFGSDATLDYVFARRMTAGDSGTLRGDAGSDHQPIWVELAP
jgi:endonuclease/exonuclease/phosphatase family metal-dependent hydrolase